MAITLKTEWQKVLEASTKVTSNVTGYLRLYLKYGGRNVETNKDIIYYEIRHYAYNPYGNYLAWERTEKFNWNIYLGTTTKQTGQFTQTPAIYSDGSERVKASGSWEQEHNSDGTWSSEISFDGYIYLTQVSAKDTIILPTIPRRTTISATDSKINGISIITLYKNSETFYHTLYYKNPSTNARIDIKTNYKDKTYEWYVPDDIYKVMSGRDIRITIGCDTYNSSGGLVGNDEKTMVASAVESEAQPTFEVIIQNEGINGVTGSLTGSTNSFIKDYTTAMIEASAVPRKWATIVEYKVTNGNKSSTLQSVGISEIPTKTFTFYVKDSRGYSPIQGYKIYKDVDIFIDYFVPKISSPTIRRTEQTSTEVVATIQGQFWNGNFGQVQNRLQYAWRSKLASSSTWGNWSALTTITSSNNNFTINNLNLGNTYATNSSYDFQFKFIDKLGELDNSKIVTTPTQNVTISTPIIEVYDNVVNINGSLTLFDKAISQGTTSYSDLSNKPALNTNNSSALSVNGSESINGTISLHKVSKTGNYNDLLNRPTIPSNTNQLTNGSGYINTSANSKAQNGYFKLSNGLIVQWGTCTTGSAVTMPTSFSSTTSFAIVGSDSSQGASATINIVVSAVNKFTAYAKYGSSYYNDTIRWIAIGY